MYACIHTYIHTYIHIHACLSIYTYIYMFTAYMQAYANTYMDAFIHTDLCMAVYTHRHIYIHKYIYKHKQTFIHVWIYMYVLTHPHLSPYICHRHGKGIRKRDDEARTLCNIWDFQHGCQLMCRQTGAVPLHMHSGFPAERLVQTIVMSLYDITRVSHATVGGNYKRRA